MGSKRYKSIKRALELSRPRDASGDATGAPVVDANSALAKYQKYRAGTVEVKIARSEASKPGSFKEVAVLPFAVKAEAGTAKYIASASTRVLETEALASTVVAANHATAIDPEVDRNVVGFSPAKAIISLLDPTQSGADKKASQITGVKYNPTSKSGYVLPFGAKAGDGGYLAVKGDILTAIKSVTAKVPKVRFRNEII